MALNPLPLQDSKPARRTLQPWWPLIFTLLCLAVWRFAGYGWFHALSEIFVIAIGLSLYLSAYQGPARDGLLGTLVSGFFWAALLDISHVLSDGETALAGVMSPQASSQLWLYARSLQAAAFLLAPHWGKSRPSLAVALFGLLATAMLATVYLGVFPLATGDLVARKTIAIGWEWALVLAYFAAALQIAKTALAPALRRALILVLALSMAVEISAIVTFDSVDEFDVMAHIFKLWAYWSMLIIVARHLWQNPLLALRERTRLLEHVLDRLPGSTFVVLRETDGSYRTPYLSAGIAQMLELAQVDEKNALAAIESRIEGDARPDLAQAFNASYATLQPWAANWRVRLARRGLRWYQASSPPPQVEADGSCVWVCHIRDISEQTEMEQTLVRHQDELSKLVEERTANLSQALAETENAARIKSEFLANMSHEMRTPLNAIIGLAHSAQRKPETAPAWPYLAQIQSSGQLLLSLINDVLDISKVEAGKLVIELQPMNLREAIQRSVKLVEPQAEAKGLSLVVRCSPQLPHTILGDETRLTQVLVNLLSNAVRFTREGEVRLNATATMTEGAGAILLSVIDTGIGISREQIARLFQPYVQGDPSITRHFGGTGLGLSICRNIVELMGGCIDVSSQPDVGTCFTIRIPVIETEALTPAAPLAAPAKMQVRLKGIKILAADDDDVNRWVLRELLEPEGAEVTLAENGPAALQALRGTEHFDVFITDLQMPEMDGYETTRQALQLRPTLPVLALTAYAMAEDRAKCLAAGMLGHLSKPLAIDLVVEAILNAVHARQPPAAQHAEETPADEALVDWASLGKALVARDSQLRYLDTFAEHYAETPAMLRSLLQARNFSDTRQLVHKIRGAAGFLNARGTRIMAQRIEEEMLASEVLVDDQVEALAANLDRVLAEVARRRQQLQQAASDTLS